MSFAWPLALLALLIIPAGISLYVLAQLRRPKYAVKFTNLDLLASVVEKGSNWKRHVPPILYLAAVAALVFAIARPETTEKVPKEEATVILLMDVSGSMKATDVQPTRLGAAKEAANVLLDTLPAKFQVALMAFSNNVRTIVPPTTNRDEIRTGLQALVPLQGTAMGDGIVQALDLAKPPQDAIGSTPGTNGTTATPTPSAVPNPLDRPAVIVLLSDGANSTGTANPIDAAHEAKARGVPIYTIALGTQAGIVDVQDNLGRTRRISVPPDPETLQEIATITEGKFFAAPSQDDLAGVYDNIGSKIGFEEAQTEIGYWFAAIAAILILASGGLSLLWFNRFP